MVLSDKYIMGFRDVMVPTSALSAESRFDEEYELQ